jgi:hypothetical protein
MKYTKAGFGAAIPLLFAGILLFSSCANILAPPGQPGENGRGGVTIRIAGEPPIRTLYPEAEFTKYTLDFYHDTSSGATSHAQIELTDGQTSVVLTDLADEDWTITAKGYVTIDIDDDPDEGPLPFAAATGTKTITVSGGTADPVTINLDADMTSGDGYISWDFHIPDDAGIQEAHAVTIRLSNSEEVGNMDLLDPEYRQGIEKLNAGYYRVQLWVSNGYHRIGHTEVVAVYSNMETTVNYVFTGDDFVPAVKTSVAVTLANTADVASIIIYGRNDNGENLLQKTVMAPDDSSYTLDFYTADSGAPIPVHFVIDVYYDSQPAIPINTGETINLGETVDLGTVRLDPIIIGGNIHFTGVVQAPNYIWIFSDRVNNGSQVTYQGPAVDGEADGTWAMKAPAALAGVQTEFSLRITTGGGWPVFDRILGTVEIPESSGTITFPDMDLSEIKWSGTIDLTVDGTFPSGSVRILAYDNSTSIGSSPVQDDGTWSITIDDSYTGVKQIELGVTVSSEAYVDLGEWRLPGTSQTNIDLGVHHYVTLRGSVEDITINGNSIISNPDYYKSVRAYPDAYYTGSRLGDGGFYNSTNWIMVVEKSPSPRNIYFEVHVYNNSTGDSTNKETGIFKTVFDSPLSGIDLGVIDFNITTLRGCIDFKINGVTPLNMSIDAYSSSGVTVDNYLGEGSIDISSGNWIIPIQTPDAPITVYFRVSGVDGNGNIHEYDTGAALSEVHQNDISGIDLGTVNLQTIMLQGTVSGTVDESAPDNYYIFAWVEGEDEILGQAAVAPDGSWSMAVPSQSRRKTLSFTVVAEKEGEQGATFIRLPSQYDERVYKTDVSGIELTGFAITTKTIRVNITSDGTNPAAGTLIICNSNPDSLTDMDRDAGMTMVIAMPLGLYNGDLTPAPEWSLKVPGDTGKMYFMVLTDSGEIYASTSPFSGDTTITPHTLDLSAMKRLFN